MSRNGHFQKVRRPTGLEVYNDAARILEELLEKRIDEDLRGPHKVRRNITDPNAERVNSPEETSGNKAQRSKTMPSKYRESKDEELKKKDLEALTDLARRASRQDSSLSSADTDDNQLDVTEKRRKKSLFKRLKERLIHASHRDQKEGFGKFPEKFDGGASPTKTRKFKRKSASQGGVTETHRHIKAHVGEDKSIEYNEERDYRDEDGAIHTGVHTVKKGKGSFFNSFRKPGKKSESGAHKKDNGTHSSGRSPSSSPQKSSESPTPTHPGAVGTGVTTRGVLIKPGQQSPLPSSTHPAATPLSPPYPAPPSSLPVSQTTDRVVRRPAQPALPDSAIQTSLNDVLDELRKQRAATDGIASSSSSTIPSSEHNGEGSPKALLSTRSNVLDSPGEDIEYIDDVEYMDVDVKIILNDDDIITLGPTANHTRGIRATGIKFHNSEGLKNLSWLADSARMADVEIDETVVSSRLPDGNVAVTTTVNATRTVVVPDVPQEEFDVVDGFPGELPALMSQKSESEKEAMYGKIAQKLIEMADSYSASMSDQESRGAAPQSPTPLSDLEKEIIRCLRTGGDRYSQQFDESVEEVKQVAKEEAYQRFRSTVQNSMGSELSWDHVAFLFYTTKGVVSGVGKGTKLANQAKEFTLQYISDTFASWIMDQGGFDTMLSSGESDFDVD